MRKPWWFVVMVAGCSDGGSSDSFDMLVAGDLRPPGDMTPPVCKGTFTPTGTARFVGMFGSCMLSMEENVSDGTESMRPIPAGYSGASPYMIGLKMVVAPRFDVRRYELMDFAPGTELFLITQDQMSRYRVGRPDVGVPLEGTTLSLDVWTPPIVPQNSGDGWIDTHMHGTLHASLVLDENTPGTPGDTVEINATF